MYYLGGTCDSAGNLTGDGLLSYTWDAESHLKSAAGVTYTYDGDGRRVKKSNGKLYWYSTSGQVLEETDLSGNLLNDYIFFGSQRIARRDASGGYYAFFADALGSARVVLGPNGTQQESDYYPFGGERVITSTLDNRYKFTGFERDAESGLDHTLNRKYSSANGRWLSPDPVRGVVANPQTLDRYPYVADNPTNRTDPLGNCFCDPFFGCDFGALFAPGDDSGSGCGCDRFFVFASGDCWLSSPISPI